MHPRRTYAIVVLRKASGILGLVLHWHCFGSVGGDARLQEFYNLRMRAGDIIQFAWIFDYVEQVDRVVRVNCPLSGLPQFKVALFLQSLGNFSWSLL